MMESRRSEPAGGLYERLLQRLAVALDEAESTRRLRDIEPQLVELKGLTNAEMELIQAYLERDLHWLQGWHAAGLPLETAHAPAQVRTEFLDDWGSILRVPQAERLPAWERYLHWERNLAQRLQGDPGVRFRLFDTVG